MLKQMTVFYWQNNIQAVKLLMVVTLNKSWFFKKELNTYASLSKLKKYDQFNLKHREMIIFHFVSVL